MKKKILTSAVFIALTSFCFSNVSCNKEAASTTPAPSVDFSFSGANVPAPATVSFTNSSTNANTYAWDFGDGGTSTIENPQHIYSAGGAYNVKLTATGAGGAASTTKNVTIANPATTADKIAGIFNGTGKQMANGISLGNFVGCVTPPGWQSHLSTGNSVTNVSKVNDNTVTFTLTGGPFSVRTFSNVQVTQIGNTISFSFGSYDVNTKFLAISANTGSYITTNACLQGLPYYSGWSALNNGTYGYTTIGHVEFSGTKP